ncbi:hypothetical protein [Paenibacillus peoriae]|uniref:hypothetical protein n=1 Tax=Paenibacillus peoriae TaxID=59893 RepID=UPI00096C4D51|nr:hypothetical protein [Paenibacillus peoriae]OMF80384.1 hypothetical protein BK145_08760 [Paenibacillus peoriae]
MPVTIIAVQYRNENEIEELRLSSMNLESYNSKYKGKLYCSMPNCEAKMEYVHCSTRPSYFRTWKHSDHANDCIYKFDRVEGAARGSGDTLSVEVSQKQILNALREAYRLSQMSEEEIEEEKSRRRNSRTTSKDPNLTATTVPTKAVISSGPRSDVDVPEKHRGASLYKRRVDALRETDIGKPRILFGIVDSVKEGPKQVELMVSFNGYAAKVKLGEAFFANSPTYAGLFYNVEAYSDKYSKPMFVGAGDVRLGKNGDYEFSVYHGEDFTVANLNLLALAAHLKYGSL